VAYSDFIIYADESGSPVLDADREDFPVFVLVFLIVAKADYSASLVPAVQQVKFEFVGHDQIVLHERDIRRQSGAFGFLQTSVALRERFMDRLSAIIRDAPVKIVAAVIDKPKLQGRYATPWSPYDLAVNFCMERAARALRDGGAGERDTEVHLVFEARGSREDQQLELTVRRIADGSPVIGRPNGFVSQFRWTPLFVDKRANSTGLQVADLVARPLGLSYLRPDQNNRSLEVLQAKVSAMKHFP